MTAFDNRWDNWAGDFAESFAARQLPAEVRDHVGAILESFGAAMHREAPAFPDDWSRTTLARVLRGGMGGLDLPKAAHALVPEVIASFLDDLQANGRLGDGSAWAEDVRSLATTYQPRRKPVTAEKGVTVRNPAGTSPTGRNDPCPCGSGKKYKKCCLARA